MVLTTNLSNHLALVTGATGGIGKATCLALARLKCNIAVHYNTAADTAATLVSELQSLGIEVHAFQADLSSYEDTRKLHAAIVKELGHPTILFNNAGLTMGKSGVKDISEISMEEFEQTWRANCGTAFLLTQLCLPSMVEKGWGRVIFCSSVAGFTGGVVGPHYAYVGPVDVMRYTAVPADLSTGVQTGLIHWLAGAYAKKGITVNGVAPALIEETKMLPGASAELSASRPHPLLLALEATTI